MNTMSKFKIGDRVAVYFATGRFTGTVLRLEPSECLSVRVDRGADKGYTWVAHEKMCRRLIKPNRRVYYINEYADSCGLHFGSVFEELKLAEQAGQHSKTFIQTHEFIVKSKNRSVKIK